LASSRETRILTYQQRASAGLDIFTGQAHVREALPVGEKLTYEQYALLIGKDAECVLRWQMIQACPSLWGQGRDRWGGRSKELLAVLTSYFGSDEVRKLIPNTKVLGAFLSGAQEVRPDLVSSIFIEGRTRFFTIFREAV